MKWTKEVEEGNFDGIIGKLKKHGYFWSFVFEVLFACYCTIMFIVDEWNFWYLLLVLASVGILSRTIELAFTKERAETSEAKAMDLTDDLIVKTRENERLTLELETTQSVLKEAKTPRNTTPQKAEAIAEEVSAEGHIAVGKGKAVTYTQKKGSEVSETPTNVPKRKPAPRGTRKPKTKNENKD